MPIREELRTRLRRAMRERDAVATGALRSALAAIADAEAVPADERPAAGTADGSVHVAGAHAGLGAAEVPRRDLGEPELAAVVEREVAEREEVAREYDGLGRGEAADRLRAEAAVLRDVVRGAPAP